MNEHQIRDALRSVAEVGGEPDADAAVVVHRRRVAEQPRREKNQHHGEDERHPADQRNTLISAAPTVPRVAHSIRISHTVAL